MNAKFVTLDVFDTALAPLRGPTHRCSVFLAAWRTDQRHNLETRHAAASRSPPHRRIRGRVKSPRHRPRRSHPDEIYAAFPGPLATAAPLMQAEELATERDICSANPAILAIYKQLVAAGVPVAFLSDTYFSQSFLESLLLNSGYDGLHRVFASSAFGASKSHGALFAKVAAQLALLPRDIWHIGDNTQSDVLHARRAGLHALWYRPKLRRPTHEDQTKYARDERIIKTFNGRYPRLPTRPN